MVESLEIDVPFWAEVGQLPQGAGLRRADMVLLARRGALMHVGKHNDVPDDLLQQRRMHQQPATLLSLVFTCHVIDPV